jgi:hypothetical protein
MASRSPSDEDHARARNWALAGALVLVVGAGFLFGADAVVLRLFGLVLLAHGAKAVQVGVELQAGGDASGRGRLLKFLALDAGVLVAMTVARVMGSWR